LGKLVFGSTAERHHFRHLQKVWNGKWRVYHNLPFRNLYPTKNLIDLFSLPPKEVKLTSQEVDVLSKTSVDYVICSSKDELVIGIDFDGMGEGYSCGTFYRPKRGVPNYRLRLMELKLKVAECCNTPFVVVGPQELSPLSPKCDLSIVDAIVGQILSSQAWRDKLAIPFVPEMAGIDREAFDQMTPQQQSFLVDDYAIGVEVIAEMTNDPISQKIVELETKLETSGWTLSFPTPPSLTGDENEPEFSDCAVSIHLKNGAKVPSLTKIRSLNSPFFLMASLLERIAKLEALLKVQNAQS
jgi:hypothetical protein